MLNCIMNIIKTYETLFEVARCTVRREAKSDRRRDTFYQNLREFHIVVTFVLRVATIEFSCMHAMKCCHGEKAPVERTFPVSGNAVTEG